MMKSLTEVSITAEEVRRFHAVNHSLSFVVATLILILDELRGLRKEYKAK